MPNTGIVKHSLYLEHRTSDGHPENHRRLEGIYSLFDPAFMGELFLEISPRNAKNEEIISVHSQEYLDRITATSEMDYCALTPDTFTSAQSFPAAILAVGGVFEAIDSVMSGKIQNAFALVRPPGHHAEHSRAMGFCLFNNIALGARYARNVLGLKRILIVDWDVHHGNGTQHTFEEDPSVLFFSTHQYPHYPGTGLFTEAGMGKGEGFTVNLPLPGGYGNGEYVSIYEKILKPIAITFKPQLILVSAGFDTHLHDPLSGMKMTEAGFAGLTRCIMEIAKLCCDGKLVLSLEGGYNLEALKQSVKAVLMELADETDCSLEEMIESADPKKVDYAIKRTHHVHQQFWKNLK